MWLRTLRVRVIRQGEALRSEDGSATAEFVLWLPVLLAFFALIADTAMILGGQAQVLRVVQDVNRAVSVGRVRDEEVAQDLVLSQITGLSPAATVLTVMDTNQVTTSVTMPAADLMATGLVRVFTGKTVTVTAQHLREG